MILASANPLQLSLAVLAAAAYALPAVRARHMGLTTARIWVTVAWLAHAAALGWGLLGEQPYFGFAPALSMTAWLVAAIYGVESQIFPQLQTRWALCAIGAGTVLLALVFPGSPMAANASLWLPVHLAVGVACYGLFGAAVVHAWFMTRAEGRIRLAEDPHSGIPLLTLERLTYRLVTAGFVLLTLTLVVGFMFGDSVYGHGHAWKWNHKTVFSVLSWFTFAVLLVGRAALGWRGKRAVRVLYVGSALLLLAYVGSRFVLEVVLERLP